MEINGQEYDAALAACRAVRPEEYDPQRAAIWKRAEQMGQVPPIYPGSTFKNCADCGIEIAVGPRIQGFMEEQPVELVCLVDAVLRAAPQGGADVINMGNPYKKRGQ